MSAILAGKSVVLGVTGGIAAYKAAELLRLLVKSGVDVRVVMTKAATQFVAPLTFQALSGHSVHLDMFDLTAESEISHIRLAQDADLIVVAPATADIIGKYACGIADDLLSTILIAAGAPVLLAPAMNDRMWQSPAVVENVATLKRREVAFVEPESGELACKTVSVGRLAEPAHIFEAIVAALTPKTLAGKTVVVSAGPTYEYWDDVRVLTNRSSGRMGFAMGAAARDKGARVRLVAGPVSLDSPVGIETTRVKSAEEMLAALDEAMKGADALVMCAAVADFRPAKKLDGKKRKDEIGSSIPLVANPDILAELAERHPAAIKVGFAAQTSDFEAEGARKLKAKGADFFVVNDVSNPAIGFDADENAGFIIDKNGHRWELDRCPKRAFAGRVLDIVLSSADAEKS